VQPYTAAEVQAMLAACERAGDWRSPNGRTVAAKRPTARRDRALLLVLVDTGVRASELCDLCMRDYDGDRRSLTVRHGKGNKQRTVFMGDAGAKALWRYLVERKNAPIDAPLFACASGRPLDRNNLRQTLQRIGGRAGVDGVTGPCGRHLQPIVCGCGDCKRENICAMIGSISSRSASQEGTMKAQPHGDDLQELIWILRRMMYMFIRWSEKKYGWGDGASVE
jgi:hypothetical protein